ARRHATLHAGRGLGRDAGVEDARRRSPHDGRGRGAALDRRRSQDGNAAWIGSRPLTQLIVASIFILLFSMLLPFRSLLYDLIYKVSIIKQFRAIGRFAWVFYFVSNIAAIVMLDKIITSLKERKRKIIAYSIMILFPLFIFSEGVSYHQFISADIKKSPNLFDIHQMPQSFQMDCSALNPNDYQSIISFPFFYIGSENFGKQATNNIYKLSFLFSYHLNLPMMSSFLTRTSIHESKNIMQLFAFNFYDKAIKNDLVSDKPFLLIYSNENLSEEEQNLLNKSKMLIKRDDYSLYELDKNILFKNNAKDEYDVFLKKKDSLFEKNNFLVSDTNLYFSFIDFDKSNAHSFGKENGCYEGLLKDMNVIYSFEGNKLKSDKQYIGRFWMYNDGENEGQDCLNAMIFFDKEKAGKSEWICLANARTTYQINGNWSLAEIQLDNIDKDAVYKLVVKGDDRSKKTIYIDHFLFFEKGMDIYKIEDRVSNQLTLFHNDHQIKVPLVKEQVTAHLIH
ncbi:MAG TPA: hypothetical protein VLB84_04120, partial [Bacteroidia bacterium]|nr:hypothetical protein [Bacteroidia bacterium]